MTGVLLAVEEKDISAGPIGLVILLLMLLATFLLIRNMNTRIRRLPRDFPEPDAQEDPPPADEAPRG